MRTTVYMILLLVLVRICDASEPNESLHNMTNAEAIVEAKLSEYSRTHDYRLLLDARRASSSLNARHSGKTLGALDVRCLKLQLETMMTVQGARDLTYDPNAPENAVYINVMPPLTTNGQVFAAGMDPEAINDPAAREQYKLAIEENKRRNEKSKRELYLSRCVDRAVISIHVFVRQLPPNSESKVQAMRMIEKIVTDKSILERLESKEHPGLTR